MSYPAAALVVLMILFALIGWSRTTTDCAAENGVLVKGVVWYECVARP